MKKKAYEKLKEEISCITLWLGPPPITTLSLGPVSNVILSFAPFGHGTKYNDMVWTQLPDITIWFGPAVNVLLRLAISYYL